MVDYRKENYKTDFESWNINYKLQIELENIETSQPTLHLYPVGAKTSVTKTPATDSSARKEKSRKE